MQRLRFWIGLVTLLLVAGISGPVLGANISVTPAGETGFAVVGGALSGVAGMDITINYDTSTMSNVKVVPGALIGSSMFLPNPNAPGVLRLAVLNSSGSISGNGNIAAITFDKTGSSPGRITRVVAELINASGAKLAVTSSFSNLAETPPPSTDVAANPLNPQSPATNQPAAPSSTTGGQTTSTGSLGAAPGMTVTMPGEGGDKEGDRKRDTQRPMEPQPPMPVPVPDVASSGSAPETPQREEKKPAPKKDIAYPSVAAKFKAFSGTPSIESLTALFTPEKGLLYEQEPRIALSNGKETLKVIVRLEDAVKSAPNFALENAKMLSLTKGEQGVWIIEALPKKDAQEATLTLFYDENTINIPLTIAPPLSAQQLGALKGLTDNDFKQFIKERGTKAAPSHDLNKDGKRDYLDDYLFVANYLAAKKKVAPVKGAK